MSIASPISNVNVRYLQATSHLPPSVREGNNALPTSVVDVLSKARETAVYRINEELAYLDPTRIKKAVGQTDESMTTLIKTAEKIAELKCVTGAGVEERPSRSHRLIKFLTFGFVGKVNPGTFIYFETEAGEKYQHELRLIPEKKGDSYHFETRPSLSNTLDTLSTFDT